MSSCSTEGRTKGWEHGHMTSVPQPSVSSDVLWIKVENTHLASKVCTHLQPGHPVSSPPQHQRHHSISNLPNSCALQALCTCCPLYLRRCWWPGHMAPILTSWLDCHFSGASSLGPFCTPPRSSPWSTGLLPPFYFLLSTYYNLKNMCLMICKPSFLQGYLLY